RASGRPCRVRRSSSRRARPYGDARGQLVMDINDFDETVPGPWEWDLKRLAASLVLAGREVGADETTARQAAFDAAGSYRRTMRALAKLPVLDAWNAVADDQLVSFAQAHDLADALQKVGAKALGNTSARFAAKSTVRAQDGGRRFTAAPPVLSEVPDATAAAVAAALGAELLVMLTDVAGLYRDWPRSQEVVPSLTATQLAELLPNLASGMVPKMEGCLRAVRAGVGSARVLDGRVRHGVLAAFGGPPVGTEVVPDAPLVRRDEAADAEGRQVAMVGSGTI
ncbi:DUF2252 family protein, partial [Kitasatospora sp. NPDC058263]